MKNCKQGCGRAGIKFIVNCPNKHTRPFERISNNGIHDVSLKLKNDKGNCIEGDLLFCEGCADALVAADIEMSNHTGKKRLLFGHVSVKTGTKYKKYVTYSRKIHEDGYLLLNKNDCFFFNEFPPSHQWEDLIKLVICDVKTKRFNTLFSEKGGKKNTRFRRWCDMLNIKGNAKESNASYSGNGGSPKHRPNAISSMAKWCLKVGPIFHPDLYILQEASSNEYNHFNSELDAMNILARMKGLTVKQVLHQDSMINHAFMICALTRNYEISVVPKSHKLVYNGNKDNTPECIPITRVKKLILQPNNVLLSFSRTLHAGGESRGVPLTKSEVDSIPIDNASFINVQKRMYDTRIFSDDDKITDLSFQFAFKLTDLTLSSGHNTGKVGTIGAYQIIEEDEDHFTKYEKEYDEQWEKMEHASKLAISDEMELIYSLIMGCTVPGRRTGKRKTYA